MRPGADAAVLGSAEDVDARLLSGEDLLSIVLPAAAVRGYGIAFCGAMYGCSLMYLSLDPALCGTTVDECDC